MDLMIHGMAVAVAASAVAGSAVAQPAQSEPPSRPAPTAQAIQKVEITGSASDVAQREAFVAGKIVLGRKTIEASGLTTVQELLKREPAVTLSADGRLGLLGLPGYTQILVDGVAPSPGSTPLELDLTRVERIEIVKGALAEFGPFGIAGTINIVTRKVERADTQSWRVGGTLGSASANGNFAWSRSVLDKQTGLSVTHRLSGRQGYEDSVTRTRSDVVDADGVQARSSREERGQQRRTQLAAATAIGWKLGPSTELSLEPDVLGMLQKQRGTDSLLAASPERSQLDLSRSDNSLLIASLPLTWKERWADGSRLQVLFSPSRTQARRHALRDQAWQSPDASRRESLSQERYRTDFLKTDYARSLGEDHDLKLGANLGLNVQDLSFGAWNDQVPDELLVGVFGKTRHLSQQRATLFVQDDWRLNEQLALNLGLTQELRAIRIREGSIDTRTDFALLAPSAHLAWRPQPGSRSRLRLSLAKTFSMPSLDQWVSRPQIHPLAPCAPQSLCGANTIDAADSAGNPALRPEQAWGLTGSYEHYLGKDSLIGIDLFTRRISDLIGSEVRLEQVPWATQARYVSRPSNLGRAHSTGISLDVRLQAQDLAPAWPKLELRSGLSVASSRVSTLPAPDNRLSGQSPWSAKLGLRYVSGALPLEVSLDAQWLPAVWQRSELARRSYTDRRSDVEAQVSWTFSPSAKLRLGLSNLLAQDKQSRDELYAATSTVLRSVSTSSERRVSVNLELKI
jgi:outer membrane receptor protein involved in Fe transport